MKRLLCITILLVACVLIAGCTRQPVTPSTDGTPTRTTPAALISPAPTTPVSGTAIARLSQSQPNASLTLNPGVFIISFQTDGSRKMGFTIHGFEDYEWEEVITTGPFTGALTFGPVIKTGKYTLNIAGNGSWTAQLIRADPGSLLTVPVNLSGSGTQVTPFFYLEKGQYIFERNVTSIPTPEFLLRFSNGSFVMDPSNTYVLPGPDLGEGSPVTWRILNITESGIYYMNTDSANNPCNWTASIITVPTIPYMGPGPLITQWTGKPSG